MPFLVVCILLAFPLAGCTEEVVEERKIDAEELVEVETPCSIPSTPISQSMTVVLVNGDERYFRLTAPSSDAGTELPVPSLPWRRWC